MAEEQFYRMPLGLRTVGIVKAKKAHEVWLKMKTFAKANGNQKKLSLLLKRDEPFTAEGVPQYSQMNTVRPTKRREFKTTINLKLHPCTQTCHPDRA